MAAEKEQRSTPAADECGCCFSQRVDQGLKPRKMVALGTTTCGYNKAKRQFVVVVCDVCDGPSTG